MAEGISISVTVAGLDDALALLRDKAAKFPQDTDYIIEEGAEWIFAESQNLVPVDTGHLQASGSHIHAFLHSEVGYNVEYAGYVEWGTSKQSPQPYMRPAMEQGIPIIVSQLEKLLE